ncbi:MAG: hypothetical protein V3T18_06015, partial [Pseudomonadales bacterium]
AAIEPLVPAHGLDELLKTLPNFEIRQHFSEIRQKHLPKTGNVPTSEQTKRRKNGRFYPMDGDRHA